MALRTLTDQAAVDSLYNRGPLASGTLIASGDYKSADPKPAEFTPNPTATSLTVVVDITAVSGAGAQIVVTIEGFDLASGKWVVLLTSAALAAVATTSLNISAYATASANVTAQKQLFETMRVKSVKSGTTTTLTYSIGGHISS